MSKVILLFVVIGLAIHTIQYFASRADYAEVYLKDCTESKGSCTVLRGKIKTDFFTRDYIVTDHGSDYIINENAISRISYKGYEYIKSVGTSNATKSSAASDQAESIQTHNTSIKSL